MKRGTPKKSKTKENTKNIVGTKINIPDRLNGNQTQCSSWLSRHLVTTSVLKHFKKCSGINSKLDHS